MGSPIWLAVIVQVPTETIVTTPAVVTVHTGIVLEVYVTARPVALCIAQAKHPLGIHL